MHLISHAILGFLIFFFVVDVKIESWNQESNNNNSNASDLSKHVIIGCKKYAYYVMRIMLWLKTLQLQALMFLENNICVYKRVFILKCH